jgi:hypothetical protein
MSVCRISLLLSAFCLLLFPLNTHLFFLNAITC